MENNEKLLLMAEIKENILNYLREELDINIRALKTYESMDNPLQDADTEIKKMREIEAIKLRHSINEINRHINVIQRMIVPSIVNYALVTDKETPRRRRTNAERK
jgi:hypothetical protein